MKSFKQFLDEKGRCWTGYKPVPGKKPFSPGSCEEVKEGLADDFAAMAKSKGYNARVVTSAQKKRETNTLLRKRAEKAKNSPTPAPRPAQPEKYPLGGYDPVSHRSYSEEVELEEGAFSSGALKPSKKALDAISKTPSSGTVRGKDDKGVYTSKTVNGKEISRTYEKDVKEETDSQFAQRMKKQAEQPPTKGMSNDEKVAKGWRNPNADKKKVKKEVELDETAAWQRKEGKRESGGLNQKGVDSYRREHPGSKLKTAVTTKPSKLKAGSAAANRRKSFCARMSGMKKRLTSAKTARDPDSRINKSLRKWNC